MSALLHFLCIDKYRNWSLREPSLAGSHLLGAILAIPAIFFLGAQSAIQLHKILVISIYGVALFSLFLASGLFHGLQCSKERQLLLEKLDYMAIYFFIAASYTPLCIFILNNQSGNTVLFAQWMMAFIGIACTAKWGFACKAVQVGIFLIMGWMFLITLSQIAISLSSRGFNLLITGCLSYSIGAFIFAFAPENFWNNRINTHLVWHICVLFGAAAHYLMIYLVIIA